MALTSTIYNFDISLADVDRGVYETLAVRAALHPSESLEYLATRLLAFPTGLRPSSVAEPPAPGARVVGRLMDLLLLLPW